MIAALYYGWAELLTNISGFNVSPETGFCIFAVLFAWAVGILANIID